MNENKFNILFVCSGNSCRSPMAEGVLKSKLPDNLREHVSVASAGTLGIDGAPATEFAIDVAAELGADISEHRSQGITEELAESADILFAMSYEHKDFLEKKFPQVRDNVFLLRSFGRSADERHDDSIDDPIGRSLETYRECCELINDELERIWPRLQTMIEEKIEEE